MASSDAPMMALALVCVNDALREFLTARSGESQDAIFANLKNRLDIREASLTDHAPLDGWDRRHAP